MKSFVRWLDRYIYVDRLRLRPAQMLPRMRPHEWVWYVAVLLASGPVLFWVWDRVGDWLAGLPGGVLLKLAAYPFGGLLLGGVWLLVLPARQARLEAEGEGWLVAALMLAAQLLYLLMRHLLAAS